MIGAAKSHDMFMLLCSKDTWPTSEMGRTATSRLVSMAAKLRKRTLASMVALADDRSLTFFQNQNLLPRRADCVAKVVLRLGSKILRAVDATCV
jgi:hypothetical protein